ncbi:hypothetical protein ACEQ8H_008493 [Pleosporales sp. CAS-2024a]
MHALQRLRQLSPPQCVLLAVHYAADGNMHALRAVTALRDGDLPLELVLSIVLTHLPEALEPHAYTQFLDELATDARTPGHDPAAVLDLAAVEQLSPARASTRRQALQLLPVVHPLYAAEGALDIFSHFLIHRAHRIDAQTGLLDLVPRLVAPFLHRCEHLRTWFISTALPLLRLSYEYYPHTATASLDDFARLAGQPAIDCLLANARHPGRGALHNVARDVKAVVAPWMCGARQRKRRRLEHDGPHDSSDWDCLFRCLLHTSRDNLPLAAALITEWDGPEDMDLGGYDEGRDYVDDEQQRKLEMQYAQTALACLYLVDQSDVPTLHTVHALLARICDLLTHEPPPELNIGVESLPRYDLDEPVLQDATTALLEEHRLLDPTNAITKPGHASIQILSLLLFSACVLSSLQYSLSMRELARISLRDDHPEQASLLQKIIYHLSTPPKDAHYWTNARLKLLWLWNWGTDQHDADREAQGVLGMLKGSEVETEILKALVESSHYSLVVQTYIKPSTTHPPLSSEAVERVILSSAINDYDGASNGNRTRGGMKRAAETVAAFAPHFPKSSRFQRMQALLSATHSMSFYSLTLQHGVPFQPVDIRASSNPLSLIQKLLSQNHGSYTKLDDLVSIGQNLVVSMPSTIMDDDDDDDDATVPLDPSVLDRKKVAAERRVIGMAIDAALEEDDFETAYSYVVNRLTPSTPSPTPSISSHRFSFGSSDSDDQGDDADDVAWQAALRAGRCNAIPPSNNSWSQSTARPDLRRLEQRMELLSQALLLAPPNRLEEVLSVWQQCETDMTALLAAETEAEERFNDAADRKLPGTFINETIAVQPRREVGRGAVEEAPMGLFDVARGAAAAFSKSAFPLRGGVQSSSRAPVRDTSMSSSRASMDLSDSGSMSGHDDRVRKRDMVANAATGALASGTGALASGLGWMLGAKPIHEQERE